MKKLYLLIILTAIFNSCTPEGNETRYFLELLPVESIDLPSEFIINQVHNIPVTYKLPTTCNTFDSFFYEKTNHKRTIAIQSVKMDKPDCAIADQTPIQTTLSFKPTELGLVVFKIWKGKDNTGIDVYEEFEVEVID